MFRPDFNFIYNEKCLCLNDASDWAFFLSKLYRGDVDGDLRYVERHDNYELEDMLALACEEAKTTRKKKALSPRAKRSKRRKTNIHHKVYDRYHGKKWEKDENGKKWYKGKNNYVLDRVHYKVSKAEAREKEYLYNPSPAEVEQVKTEEQAETMENTFCDFLWYLIDTLPEGKYIMIYDYDNGEQWEDHEYRTNEFLGIMTKDEVIHKITENFLRNDCGVDVNETKIRGLKGTSFHWDFGCDCDRWEWNGYEDFIIIPVSELN